MIINIDINNEYVNFDDLLTFSADNNIPDLVKYALDNGANIHDCDRLGLVSRMGWFKVVKLLLEYGANVHRYNESALDSASEEGEIKIVKLLLDYGADASAISEYALRGAKEKGGEKLLDLLIEHGAKL